MILIRGDIKIHSPVKAVVMTHHCMGIRFSVKGDIKIANSI